MEHIHFSVLVALIVFAWYQCDRATRLANENAKLRAQLARRKDEVL